MSNEATAGPAAHQGHMHWLCLIVCLWCCRVRAVPVALQLVLMDNNTQMRT